MTGWLEPVSSLLLERDKKRNCAEKKSSLHLNPLSFFHLCHGVTDEQIHDQCLVGKKMEAETIKDLAFLEGFHLHILCNTLVLNFSSITVTLTDT